MIIGVTGGVGVGKSTVLDILKSDYKAYIILADEVARELMEPRNCAFDAVISAFGDEILCENSSDTCIDRIKLSKIVFNDPEKLKLLNSIIHPLVKEKILSIVNEIYSNDKDALIILEAALLIETDYADLLDHLWYVFSNKETRINRLMENRGYSIARCEDIMNNQLSDEEFRANCDFVIDNSGSIESTKEQIVNWFKNF